MASDKKVQAFTGFTSGEYSNDLAGHVDAEDYGFSARKLSNFLIEDGGGIKRFYGTYNIQTPVITPTQILLIPFASRIEPMCLVLTDTTVGLLASYAYYPLSIAPLTTSSLRNVRWQQVNDKIYIVAPDMQPMTIDFVGETGDANAPYSFVANPVVFKEEPFFPVGWNGNYTGPVTVTALAPNTDPTRDAIQVTIEEDAQVRVVLPSPLGSATEVNILGQEDAILSYSPTGNYTLAQTTFEFVRVRGGVDTVLLSGIVSSAEKSHTIIQQSAGGIRPGSSVRPGTTGSITYRYGYYRTISTNTIVGLMRQNGYTNVNYLGALGELVMDLPAGHQAGDGYYVRLSTPDSTSDGQVGPAVDLFGAKTIKNYWQGWTVTSATVVPAHASDLYQQTDIIGRKIKFRVNPNTEFYTWYEGEQITDTNQIRYSDGHYYRATTTGTCGKEYPRHTSGIVQDGGVTWKYVNSGMVSATVTAVIDSKTLCAVIDNGEALPVNHAGESSYAFDHLEWSIWGYAGVYPSDVVLYNDRLFYITNTAGYGCWYAGSVTDDYNNFAPNEYGQVLDTSAIIGIVTDCPDGCINWVLAINRLFFGGYHSEHELQSGTTSLTPTTAYQNKINENGGARVVPVRYKELNVFTGAERDALYTLSYDENIRDYRPRQIGIYANHLLSKGIVRVSPFKTKDDNIYILHDNGDVSVMKYVTHAGRLAFSRLNCPYTVADIASTVSNNKRCCYMACLDENGKLIMQAMANENPTYMWNAVIYEPTSGQFVGFSDTNFFNRDVWVRYGADLEQFVKVHLDGTGQPDYAIPNSQRYMVGLVMESEFNSQPAFGRKIEGAQQQSINCYLRIKNSGAFSYGASCNESLYYPYDYWTNGQFLGSAHDMYTGDLFLNLPIGYAFAQNQGGSYSNTEGIGVNLKMETPEPFTLLSVWEIYK